ncbi:MAG: HAMP domain-containing sensor histidine kinase [Phycisphaerae bacterium]
MILLLAIAVILPTVCLLWFMTQAVRNERLAVQQKLIDVYAEKARRQFVELPNMESKVVELDNFFRGTLVYEPNGTILFPIMDSDSVPESNVMVEAFRLEIKGDFEKAIGEYEKVAETQSESVRYKALLSKARCLSKLDRTDEAIEITGKLCGLRDSEGMSTQTAAEILRARVFLAELYRQSDNEKLYEHLEKYLGSNSEEVHLYFENAPAEVVVWQLEKLIDIAKQAGLAQRLKDKIDRKEGTIEAYQNSIEVAEMFPNVQSLDGFPGKKVMAIEGSNGLYGLKLEVKGNTALAAISRDYLADFFADGVREIQDDIAGVQVLDNLGRVVAGDANLAGKPFYTTQAGGVFGDFEAALYFRDDSVFEDAASRQAAIYIWTSVLVVVLILASGAIATQAIGRQIRLNRLKNDFIATVTHELKTPLSSMRVLVDTLLEGNYEGEQTATEYLQLISRENERLSHLIDNFLTFSRMERNKQAFEIAAVSPVEIANSAVEALRTKFEKHNVNFTVEIAKPLPMISADRDAMVTVLVNLLDNAFKYTKDDKKIELRVFKNDGFVCFTVKDNGIGMTRRQISRAFERFYQADNSLSRRTEGAGLGLSIVKFIVDAHKGRISISSKPVSGCLFTVRIKACAENGNDTDNRR